MPQRVFTPRELTIAPGETVKLANAGGTHNFRSFRRNAAGRRLTAGRCTLRLRIAGEEQPALRFRVR